MTVILLLIMNHLAGAVQPAGQTDAASAAHCLTRLWPRSELRLARGTYYSYRDTKSYSPLTHVVLVTRSGRRRGQVFDLELRKKAILHVRLVNNADIQFTPRGMEFTNPPWEECGPKTYCSTQHLSL